MGKQVTQGQPWCPTTMRAADDGRSTTTGAVDYRDKVALLIPAVSGTIGVRWTCTLDGDAAKQVRVRLYDATGGVVLQEHISEPKRRTEQLLVSGFAYVTMAGVAKTIKVQFKPEGQGDTAGAQKAAVEAWRVS
jgi:hypothetical protein